MLVPDIIRKSVIFLASKRKQGGEPRVGGTAFFIAVKRFPLEDWFVYLVTAKHCIDKISSLTDEGKADGKVYLRINSTEAETGIVTVETEFSDWYYHPTESEKVDVAVYPISSIGQWDIKSFGLQQNTIVDTPVIEEEKIGPGDEVFIAGLFTRHFGKNRNIPIVRIGNIAGMPEEPVYPDWCHPHPMESYLIEARSIGGLSGSPVFVNVGLELTTGGLSATGVLIPHRKHHRGDGRFYLLGLVHGHWGFRVPDIDASPDGDEDQDDQDDGETKKVNAGIAMVVPATKIYEVVNQPKLVEARARVFEEEMRKRSNDAIPD